MSENIVMLTFLFMSPNLRLNEQQIVIKNIKILILFSGDDGEDFVKELTDVLERLQISTSADKLSKVSPEHLFIIVIFK